MSGRRHYYFVLLAVTLAAGGCAGMQPSDLGACLELARTGFRPVATERAARFLGKLEEETVRCRGGDNAVEFRDLPWVDWQNYWATADASSRAPALDWLIITPNRRGIRGALLDLEHQRMEMIKFNLFDNSGTYKEYVEGREESGQKIAGPLLKVWDAMRLPKDDPKYKEIYKELLEEIIVRGDGSQECHGELIRFRTLTGICNDIKNPLMGSTGQPFARNVEFEATTFVDLEENKKNEWVEKRHGKRLDLLKPDPQVISRKLFTRKQEHPDKCNAGLGLDGYSPDAHCDYKKAPFFNVLAAFWIQFMTHDWFSHLEEGHNSTEQRAMGCATQLVNNVETRLSPDDVAKLGCRPDDRIDKAYVNEPSDLYDKEKKYLTRAYKITQNTVTAWWDASQIYGYDGTSRQRVKHVKPDPGEHDPVKLLDSAKLLMNPYGQRGGADKEQGYLPVFSPADVNDTPQWADQEATAFPDNWSIGLSFFHNVFSREHNRFVEVFKERVRDTPDEDSGLRNPAKPDKRILYKDVTADELFKIARLVVSAEIAKIHTIEWTTQLLYDEPLYLGMNANWHGLFEKYPAVAAALEKVVSKLGKSDDPKKANQLYSAFAAGPGIFGLGSRRYDKCWFRVLVFLCSNEWSLENPEHINGGTNHFGSPFNFPEEFVTVYRLHTMVPDLLEYREWDNDPNLIRKKIPVVETFRGKATKAMHDGGLANWALSMGRQRLGKLTPQNHPQFLQNLPIDDRLQTPTGKIDVAALDLIRDRERGVPRFNEFRRQYGLKSLTSFDDFIDRRPPRCLPKCTKQEWQDYVTQLFEQKELVDLLREVYGQHECDRKKIITTAQVDDDGKPINDCLGHEKRIPLDEKILVDNIEDLDTVVGWLAEPVRPHGFAISETQFQVFILNASRRLFSDRFFTSSFRKEFYSHLGVEWVTNNGPAGECIEKGWLFGNEVERSPLKCVLRRTIPELRLELEQVVNVFDPWARDRGEYYSLQWKPRPGAESDPAFRELAQ